MFAFTVRQLEVYLAVCRTGGFRRAADALGISEAGVSDHIRTLEKQLGHVLFERRRGTSGPLTPEGAQFRQEAEAFIAGGLHLSRTWRTMRPAGRALRLHVGPHLLEDAVRPALPDFLRRHGDLSINFVAMPSRGAVQRELRTGTLDGVLLTVRNARDLPGSILLSPAACGIYGSAGVRSLAEEQGLGAIPYILAPDGTEEGLAHLRLLRDLGVAKPQIAARVQFHDAAVHLAAAGAGALVTLGSIVKACDSGGGLRLIHALPAWERRLYLRPTLDKEIAGALTDFLRGALRPMDAGGTA